MLAKIAAAASYNGMEVIVSSTSSLVGSAAAQLAAVGSQDMSLRWVRAGKSQPAQESAAGEGASG